MKNSNFSAVYIAALVIGAILVLANSSDSLYQTIVIIVGVLFLLTSGYMLLSAFLRKDKTHIAACKEEKHTHYYHNSLI